MFDGLFLVSLIGNLFQGIKDVCTPKISSDKWANKDLMYKDMVNCDMDAIIKNAKNGKYVVTETYPEPHRNPKTGKIVIENELLYKKDCLEYGSYQAWKWAKQGKYNLTPEEFEKEKERIKKKLEYLYRL